MDASLVVSLAAGATAGLVAAYKKWLTPAGSIAAALLGALVWYTGRWATALPLLFFFISGSLLSRIPSQNAADSTPQQHKGRTAWQVWCNGGVAAACLLLHLLYGGQLGLQGYLASLAISTADTWSSELGRRFGGTPRNIITGRYMAPGLSGGVSFLGSMAGIMGAAAMAVLAYLYHPQLHGTVAVGIAVAGFAGMLADSVMGSLWQVKYTTPHSGILTEHPTPTIARGLPWMDNNWVNLLSNMIITILFCFLLFWAMGGSACFGSGSLPYGRPPVGAIP